MPLSRVAASTRPTSFPGGRCWIEPTSPLKTAAFSQYPRRENDAVMGYSIRTDRFRYTEWQENWKTDKPKVIARELYDHESDPRETVNIADDPKHADTLKRLAQQLKAGWKHAS